MPGVVNCRVFCRSWSRAFRLSFEPSQWLAAFHDIDGSNSTRQAGRPMAYLLLCGGARDDFTGGRNAVDAFGFIHGRVETLGWYHPALVGGGVDRGL